MWACTEKVIDYHDHFMSPLVVIAILSVIAALYFHIKNYRSQNGEMNKLSFYMGAAFYASLIIWMPIGALYWHFACQLVLEEWLHWRFMSSLLWNVQLMLCFGIFYHRLYKIFAGTAFRMNTWTVRISLGFFGILVIQSFMNSFLGAYYLHLTWLFNALIMGCVTLVGFPLWMTFMFVHKLNLIYKHADNDDTKYIATKLTLLNAISSTATSLQIIVVLKIGLDVAANFTMESFENLIMMQNTLGFFDVYTNFMMVFLTYRHFDVFYKKMCMPCHNACLKCEDFYKKTTGAEANLSNEMKIKVDTKTDLTSTGTNTKTLVTANETQTETSYNNTEQTATQVDGN